MYHNNVTRSVVLEPRRGGIITLDNQPRNSLSFLPPWKLFNAPTVSRHREIYEFPKEYIPRCYITRMDQSQCPWAVETGQETTNIVIGTGRPFKDRRTAKC